MLKTENFPNAYKEIFVILNNVDEEQKSKIPDSFINMVKENMNNDYDFKLDKKVEFENQKLLKETEVILQYIFLHYLGTQEQRKIIIDKFKQDMINSELGKGKYDRNKMFRDEKTNKTQLKTEENKMIEYKKQNFIKRFFTKIKKIFIKKY